VAELSGAERSREYRKPNLTLVVLVLVLVVAVGPWSVASCDYEADDEDGWQSGLLEQLLKRLALLWLRLRRFGIEAELCQGGAHG